jgi:hypothetical protein
MKNGKIVGNIVVIDFKYRVRIRMSKIKIARWILLEIFLMLSLDTLYLNNVLPYMPNSNGRIGYMVGNHIQIPFQWYMAFPLTP